MKAQPIGKRESQKEAKFGKVALVTTTTNVTVMADRNLCILSVFVVVSYPWEYCITYDSLRESNSKILGEDSWTPL